jgi:hypothetical protein
LPVMKYLVIACNIMKDELLRVEAADGISFIFLDQSLHRTPQKMKQIIQAEIDKAEGQNWDYVILGYGLCSNGILGIRAKGHPLIVPRVHDCIALFLGSCEMYLEEHRKEPGTYYLTKSWIEEAKSPLGVYNEYCERYGKETAEWVIREELKNYTRIALIDTGVQLLETHREHAIENARFLNLKFEDIKGSLQYFEKMLHGVWGKDFLLLNPGEELTQKLFFDL